MILALLYMCQVVPHHHLDPWPADHTSVPISHANHSHQADEDEEGATDLPESAHHHELTHHLDFHVIRTLSPKLNSVPGIAFQVVHFNPTIEDPIRVQPRVPSGSLPVPIPITPFDPRGPPLMTDQLS